jgi:putative peptidoglycan lipid II flippase
MRTVVRNFIPALTSRGVVQISAYVDLLIATFLPAGAPAAIAYAQTLYNLPVSLFGMSVSAAELPRMSGASGAEEERHAQLRERLAAGLRQIAYFVIPTVGAFITLGHVVAAALFETGQFSRADSLFVWKILAAAAVGLLAGTLGRLYASTFFALQDTRTPMRLATLRVGLGIGLGVLLAVVVPRWAGIDATWGAPGLALAGSLAGWVEFALLRRKLTARIGHPVVDRQFLRRLWFAATLAALFSWGLLSLIADLHPLAVAAVVLGCYVLSYLGITLTYEIPEAQRLLARVRRRPSSPA